VAGSERLLTKVTQSKVTCSFTKGVASYKSRVFLSSPLSTGVSTRLTLAIQGMRCVNGTNTISKGKLSKGMVGEYEAPAQHMSYSDIKLIKTYVHLQQHGNVYVGAYV